ncbi:MAG: ribonuclease [Devosia sp.]
MRVDPRLTLALVLMFLAGGAVALWLSPQSPPPAPPEQSRTIKTPAIEEGRIGLYTLALSWQPAFCETEPNKPECRSLKTGRFDADHFALHGLWPEDSYCGVAPSLIDDDQYGSRRDLPDIEIAPATRDALDKAMPGTQSLLERHEWLNHGTCSGVSAQTYFSRAIALLDAVNASALRDLFADNAGRRLTRQQIVTAFESSFGRDLGSRMRVDCLEDGGRTLIGELRIRLYGDVMSPVAIGQLLRAATPGASGCGAGLIDRVGDQ